MKIIPRWQVSSFDSSNRARRLVLVLSIVLSFLGVWQPLPSIAQTPTAGSARFTESFKFKEIEPGIEYGQSAVGHASNDESTGPWFINALRIYSILGGGPQLIKAGKIAITNLPEKITPEFVNGGHPRIAIATLESSKLLLITVGGHQPGESIGMSLTRLAEILLEFGAVDAINPDGGGSTTMVIHNKVVNRPSDQAGERPVGDAILVFPKPK